MIDGYKISDHLPGPLSEHSREELLVELEKTNGAGTNHSQWMEWAEKYGDAGYSSNIVVPHLARERGQKAWLCEKVLLSDPDDCVRIARAHTQKEPNFQLFMGDSVISATDNTVWQAQRNHMTEAFMPMSSMAKIFPTSVARASLCKDILGRLSQGGTQKVNMTEFFLNETQQQLHLALFGEDESTYDEAYNATFRDGMGGPPADPIFAERHERAAKRAEWLSKNPDNDDGMGGNERSRNVRSLCGRICRAFPVAGRIQSRLFSCNLRAFEYDRQSAPVLSTPVAQEYSIESFLSNLNKTIMANQEKFAAPSDVAADPNKTLRGPLSAVLGETPELRSVHV